MNDKRVMGNPIVQCALRVWWSPWDYITDVDAYALKVQAFQALLFGVNK